MKSKFKLMLMMFALLLGLSVTTAAQTRSRTRDGRAVTVYQNNGRGFDRNNDRNFRRDERRDNHRSNDWRSDGRWRLQKQRQVFGGRTYRLPNGRFVTILPNGRRIYR